MDRRFFASEKVLYGSRGHPSGRWFSAIEALTPTMTDFKPATNFGKYRILRLLGQGGMADVYEAEETTVGRVVALKVLPAAFARDQERARRFAKEIQASAALDHPNIVSVFDVGEVDGLHYYTMSVLRGSDLKARLKEGALPEAEAIRTTSEIAGALHYAHEKGFVHRDIKPENILFREDGSAVLTDFGIARATSSQTRMTATGLSIGTPHYMSPEQARGKEVDGRSDLYALGVVLYEMLTGRVPFDSTDSLAIGIMHLQSPVPELPDELARFQGVLDGLLAKDPKDRTTSGSELVDELKKIESGGSVPRISGGNQAKQPDAVQHPDPGSLRRLSGSGWFWGLSGTGAALCLITLVMLLSGGNPTDDVAEGSDALGVVAGPVSSAEDASRARDSSGEAEPRESETDRFQEESVPVPGRVSQPEAVEPTVTRAAWSVGNIVPKSRLTSAVLIPGYEGQEPFGLMEMFHDRLRVEGRLREFLVTVHGKPDEKNAEFSDMLVNPALVTVAVAGNDGFEVLYRRRFAYERGRDSDLWLFQGAGINGQVVSIDSRSAEGNSFVFQNDQFTISLGGNLVEVSVDEDEQFEAGNLLPLRHGVVPSPVRYRDGRFVKRQLVSKSSDASCCPTGGTLFTYYELERQEDSAHLRPVEWKHLDDSGNVLDGSKGTRDATDETEAISTRDLGRGSGNLLSGLVAHYPLNSTGMDASEAKSHLEIRLATFGPDRSGNVGSALVFDETRASATARPSLPVGSEPRSISAWFQTSDSGGSGGWGMNTVFSYGRLHHESRLYKLAIYQGRLFFGSWANDDHVDTFVADGKWHHAVLTYDGQTHEIWLDGEKVVSRGTRFDTAQSPLVVGQRIGQEGAQEMNGAIDCLRIYKRALTPDEIELLFREDPEAC